MNQVCMIDSAESDALAREIDQFHRKHEDKYRVKVDCFQEIQLDINSRMRGILVDWLVEVGEEYKLNSATLHLSVHCVDRYLSTASVPRGRLQLLGCACMMVACKYEEVFGPSVDDFVYISDNTYTNDQMLAMEKDVLEVLDFRLSSTHVYHFLERFVLAGCTTESQNHFAHVS
jgi:cyclin A